MSDQVTTGVVVVDIIIDPVVYDHWLDWWQWSFMANAMGAVVGARSPMSSGNEIAVAMHILDRSSRGGCAIIIRWSRRSLTDSDVEFVLVTVVITPTHGRRGFCSHKALQ